MHRRQQGHARDSRVPAGLPHARGFGTEAWGVGRESAPLVPVARREQPAFRAVTAAPFAACREHLGDVWRAGYRHRYQVLPWLLLPLPPAVAVLGRRAGAEVAVTLTAVAGAVAAGRVARPRLYATACCVTAAVWVTWAAWAGVRGDFALPAWVVAWLLLALPWWNRHRIRHACEHAGPPEVPSLPLTSDELLDRLRTRICGQGQRLAGAQVRPGGEIRGGRWFEFSLDPGRQTFEHVRAASAEIASAGEVPRARVVVEPAPGDTPGEDGPANLARVTILDTRNAHREIHEFGGMTLARETGLFHVGPYADEEMALARLYKADEDGRPMRAASGLICGAQGSGKSRFMEHMIAERMASGLFKVWLLDGQGGASLPGLLDHVDWAATWAEEWERCMRAAVRLMISRTRQIAAQRLSCWHATPEQPFVQIEIEEAHKPLRLPVVMRCVKAILQEGEKVGMGVDPSTQFPSQAELGGSSGAAGANALRSLASSGNVILFRTGDSASKSMAVGSVEVDPRQLPQVPGMCHPLGASMRLAPARAIRVKDPGHWAALAPPTSFTDVDLAALGGDYATRRERFAEHDVTPEAATLDMGSLEAELALITGEAPPGLAPADAAGRAETRTAIAACWEFLSEHREAKRADLIAAVGYTASAVDQALAALERTGKVRRGTGHGAWELSRPALRAVGEAGER